MPCFSCGWRRITSYGPQTEENSLVRATCDPQPFRFLDLPADIRVHFYRIYLVHKRGLVRLFDRKQSWSNKSIRPNLGVNLLLTCRQIFCEARDILYKLNIFCIMPAIVRYNSPSDPRCSVCGSVESSGYIDSSDAALESMGANNRALIRHVEIMLMDGSDEAYDFLLEMFWTERDDDVDAVDDVQIPDIEFRCMRELLPNVADITLFFPFGHFFGGGLDHYTRLLKLLPSSPIIQFDFSEGDMIHTPEYFEDLRSRATSVFGSKPLDAQSEYWKLETLYQDRFERRTLEYISRLENFGLEALASQRDYAYGRVELANESDMTDNESFEDAAGTDDEFDQLYGTDILECMQTCINCGEEDCPECGICHACDFDFERLSTSDICDCPGCGEKECECGGCHNCHQDQFSHYFDYKLGMMVPMYCSAFGGVTDEWIETHKAIAPCNSAVNKSSETKGNLSEKTEMTLEVIDNCTEKQFENELENETEHDTQQETEQETENDSEYAEWDAFVFPKCSVCSANLCCCKSSLN